ncbi:MAG: toxin PIN, partial [Roseburia sp.]|nr:toxin PIN [Roseburia sp.]
MKNNIGGGYVVIGVKQEDLEDSINGLSQLKLILQAQLIKSNGANKRQAAIDVKELGKHFDTAIDAMTILLSGFD